MTQRRPVALALGLAVLLVAAACGDSAGSPTTTTSTISRDETETPPDTGTRAPDPTPPAPGQPLPARISTTDGVDLESLTWPAGPDWVVLAHMRPADLTSWLDFAEVLQGEGYTALAFNFRGYGNSTGPQEPFAVDTDVIAAVDFARERGAERVFVIGASMGGTGALVAAAQRDVAGVATLSAPDVFFDADAVGAVADIAAPKLFVAAEDDGPYNTIVGDLFAAAGEPKLQQLYSGSDHGTDLFASHGDELRALLLDFLANS